MLTFFANLAKHFFFCYLYHFQYLLQKANFMIYVKIHNITHINILRTLIESALD